MDHQLFAALFVLALIGQHLATAAPLSATKSSAKPHHQEQHQEHHQEHHQGQHDVSSGSSIRQIENILKELDHDTTVMVRETDKVIEIYPEQRELPAGTEQPPAPRRQRRSARRRSRRSAAFLLHATMRMCNLRPIHCQSILLQRDNFRVNIRLVDE